MTTSPPPGRVLRPAPVPRSVQWLSAVLLGIAVVATWAADAIAPQVARPGFWDVAAIFAALLVSGLLALEYHYRGQTDAFDHFEAALVPALYFLPPVWVVGIALVAKIAGQAWRRVQPAKAAFNVAQWTLAAAVGALAYAALQPAGPGWDLAAVAVATVAAVAINVLAMQVLLALLQVRSPLAGPEGTGVFIRSTTFTGVVNISFGVLFVAVIDSRPAAAPLLLVPLAMLHVASRGYAVTRADETRQRTTQVATYALHAGDDVEAGLAHFMAAAADGLNREGVDLIVCSGDQVEVRRWRRSTPTAAPTTGPLADADPLVIELLTLDEPTYLDAQRGGDELCRLLRAAGHRECIAAQFETPGARGVFVMYGARAPMAMPQQELAVVVDLAREIGLARERADLMRTVLLERGRMTQIVNDVRDGIVTLGPSGDVRTWNPALERITGYQASDLVGTDQLGLLEPVDAQGRPVRFNDWVRLVDEAPADVSVRTRDGERRWLSCSYSQGRDDADRSRTLIVMARDVTQLRQVERRLAGQTAVLERIAAGEPLAVSLDLLAAHLADPDDELACAVLLVHGGVPDRLDVAGISGVTVDELVDINALRTDASSEWLGRAVHDRASVFVEDVELDPPSAAVRIAARRHGFRSCSAVPIRAAYDDRVIGAVGLLSRRPRPDAELRDRGVLERAAHLAAVAVERSEFEARLAHQATHDALTSLPNRAVLLERCESVLAGLTPGHQAVMVFIDIDRFKLVNDSLGHDAGDRLLVEVAQRLSRVVRPTDTVARFGGDEFTVLSEGWSEPSHVLVLASRLLAAFATPFAIAGTHVVVTASLGVALGEMGTEADELVNDADAAMYRAKERGGSRYELYDSSMREPSMVQLVTNSALHHALDHDELVVVYQPIVALGTGAVVGAEALVRWRHPERGVLLPDSFLPLAERTGLVVPIGRHVMALACEQAARWRTAGLDGTPLKVNINLSARELGQSDLAAAVGDLLHVTGADPRSICFEITESALVHDVDAATSTLRELKELGVELTIDDFGTGYAPLTYLRRFPVDGLKIDRSFVNGLDQPGHDRAIVSAVISLARSLDLTTTGEGVETVAQLEVLRDLGCESAQGYLLAMPSPAEDVVLHTSEPGLQRFTSQPDQRLHLVWPPPASG